MESWGYDHEAYINNQKDLAKQQVFGLFGGHDKACVNGGDGEKREIFQKVGYACVICEEPEYIVVTQNINAHWKRSEGAEDNTVVMEIRESKDWSQY